MTHSISYQLLSSINLICHLDVQRTIEGNEIEVKLT